MEVAYKTQQATNPPPSSGYHCQPAEPVPGCGAGRLWNGKTDTRVEGLQQKAAASGPLPLCEILLLTLNSSPHSLSLKAVSYIPSLGSRNEVDTWRLVINPLSGSNRLWRPSQSRTVKTFFKGKCQKGLLPPHTETHTHTHRFQVCKWNYSRCFPALNSFIQSTLDFSSKAKNQSTSLFTHSTHPR